MSRHWKPEIVGREWTRPSAYQRGAYRRGSGGKVALLLLGAVAVGLAAGMAWQDRPAVSVGSSGNESGPSSAIEWNAVQAVPTRARDAEDAVWERRSEQDRPSTSSGRTDAGDAVSVSRGDAPPNTITGTIYVIDGDTFSLAGRRIRILGMDAPETHPSRCAQEAQLGNAATDKLRALLSSGTITMSGSGVDRYGRALRQVFVNGVDVADTMISAGLARSYDGGKKLPWC